MPFMTKLTNLAKQAGTRVVGVSVEDLATNRAYLQRHGVNIDAVISVRDNGLRVQPTPTLLLVRRDGTVMKSWRGKVDGAREQEVLAAIEGTV
jgi:peroxiredoxin